MLSGDIVNRAVYHEFFKLSVRTLRRVSGQFRVYGEYQRGLRSYIGTFNYSREKARRFAACCLQLGTKALTANLSPLKPNLSIWNPKTIALEPLSLW